MPTPREETSLIGHDAAEATLHREAEGDRLHHAWLLGGPEGIGKATLAWRFARWLLAGSPPGLQPPLALPASHPTFRRVVAHAHADVRELELEYDTERKRLRTEITVGQVRDLVGFFQRTAAEGGWRIAIIDGAEHLNPHAANALLKLLEEPPPRCLLLMVSHAPGLLLPTLRSRCRTLRLAPLDTAALAALIGRHLQHLAPAEQARLATLARGSFGRALRLADAAGPELAGIAEQVLDALPGLDHARMVAIAEGVARTEARYDFFMELLRESLSGAIRSAARAPRDAAPAGLPGRLAALRPLAAWSEVWHALGRLQAETVNAHLDRRQAVVAALRLLA